MHYSPILTSSPFLSSWVVFTTQLNTDSLHYSLYQILRKRFSATTLSRNMADSYSCLAITMIYVTLQVLYVLPHYYTGLGGGLSFGEAGHFLAPHLMVEVTSYQEVCGHLLYFCRWQNASWNRHVQYISIEKPFKNLINHRVLLTLSLFSNFPNLIRVEQLSASTMIPKEAQFTEI